MFKARLKELKLNRGILSYFGRVQNYFDLNWNLKIVRVYYDGKTPKRYLTINHKGTGMFKDGDDLTRITNQELEKSRLDFSRCANFDPTPSS